jgi:hypothetical protein
MKRFTNMSEDERRGERLRRLPAVVKAFRDMDSFEIRRLVAMAVLCSGKTDLAKAVIP